MARIVWQLVGVLLLIGFVGAYFWPSHSHWPPPICPIDSCCTGLVAKRGLSRQTCSRSSPSQGLWARCSGFTKAGRPRETFAWPSPRALKDCGPCPWVSVTPSSFRA